MAKCRFLPVSFLFGDGRNEQVTASLTAAKENTADDTVLLALSEWSGIITSMWFAENSQFLGREKKKQCALQSTVVKADSSIGSRRKKKSDWSVWMSVMDNVTDDLSIPLPLYLLLAFHRIDQWKLYKRILQVETKICTNEALVLNQTMGLFCSLQLR